MDSRCPVRPQSPSVLSSHSFLRSPLDASSLTSRLRQDRDSWRTLAREREQDLHASQTEVLKQNDLITTLKNENASLDRHHPKGSQTINISDLHIQQLKTKHDELSNRLQHALRTIARLKKSDRTKDKIQQRNLRLKAALRRVCTRHMSSTPQPDHSIEAALREALALTDARLCDLESSGRALLATLDVRTAAHATNTLHNDDAAPRMPSISNARAAYKQTLLDDAFAQQRENWVEWLED
ncbi:hypothetical protein ACN47E_002443 [Coniothyrium glycines]